MASRTTPKVSLTLELNGLIEARDRAPVGSGEELKREIDLGLDQLRRGERVDGEEFFAYLRAQRAE